MSDVVFPLFGSSLAVSVNHWIILIAKFDEKSAIFFSQVFAVGCKSVKR